MANFRLQVNACLPGAFMPFPEFLRSGLRVSCSIIALCGFWLAHDVHQARYELVVEGESRFADARSIQQASIRTSHPIRNWFNAHSWWLPTSYALAFDANTMQDLGVQVWKTKDGNWLVRAGTRAGALPVTLWHIRAGEKRAVAQQLVVFQHNHADRDADGLPDVMELRTENERSAFTGWFTAIAEAQATHIDDRWATIHQDCAGLVRFAYREAMRSHDPEWLAKWKYLPAIPAERNAHAFYPDLPIVGDLPFRARGGSYDPEMSRHTQFSAAPNARTLWQHNTTFISKDIAHARAGDLLFFEVPDASGSRLHTMIALGETPASSHHAIATRVVYHNGLAAPQGEVRLVRLSELQNHPDQSWHPARSNPRFIGVHRLSHLVFETQTTPRFAWDSRQRSHL